MLKIVVSIVFKLLSIISTLILAPIVTLLSPFMEFFGFASFVPYFLSFVDTCLMYANFFIICLHIPLAPLLIVVSVCGVIITFNISMRAVLMVLNIYKAIRGSSNTTAKSS